MPEITRQFCCRPPVLQPEALGRPGAVPAPGLIHHELSVNRYTIDESFDTTRRTQQVQPGLQGPGSSRHEEWLLSWIGIASPSLLGPFPVPSARCSDGSRSRPDAAVSDEDQARPEHGIALDPRPTLFEVHGCTSRKVAIFLSRDLGASSATLCISPTRSRRPRSAGCSMSRRSLPLGLGIPSGPRGLAFS